MPTLQELLQSTDPETLKKLGLLRDDVPAYYGKSGLDRFNDKYAAKPQAFDQGQMEYPQFQKPEDTAMPAPKPTGDNPVSGASNAEDIDALNAPKNPRVSMANQTPDISGKLTANDAMAKAQPVTELGEAEKNALNIAGQAQDFNPLGEKGLEYLSKAGKVAGKVLKPVAAIGALTNASSAIQNAGKGNYIDAASDAAGAGSSAAFLMGSPLLSGALAGGQLGIKQGMEMGKREAQTGVDENGNNFDPSAGMPSSAPATTPPMAQKQSTPGPYDPSRGVASPQATPTTTSHIADASKAVAQAPAHDAAPEKSYKDMYQGLLDVSNENSQNTVAGLKAAQDKENHEKGIAGLIQGANTFASGALGKAFHTMPTDLTGTNKAYDEASKNAELGVQQYKDLTEQEKNDPNSPASQRMRSISAPIFGKLGIKMPSTMSFNEIEKNFPMMGKMFDVQATTEARKESAKDRNAMLQMTMNNKHEADTQKNQDKANQQFIQLAEGSRQRPDVRAAETDLYNINKANEITDLYKNPDSLPPQLVRLQSMEMAKVATGGVPTHEDIQAINNGAVPMQAAAIVSKFLNRPLPASQGEFVKMNQQYLNALKGNAQNVIKTHLGNSLEAYRKQMGEEYYNGNHTRYLKPFETAPQPASKIKVSNGKETLMIDPSDLQHATADGYNQVQ